MPLDHCTEATCFGCGACCAVCPVNAISMVIGEGGFRYPRIDAARCIHCGKCDRACPIDNADGLLRAPTAAYAVWDQTAVRAQSTSGGAFSALAKTVLSRGGVVIGAVLDLERYKVTHQCATTEAELVPLRKSKYVQSEAEGALRQALTILRKGRPVLFVGTPCQVAGYRLLTQSFGDLALSCDLVCGSVPSPTVFKCYLKEEETKAKSKVIAYDFRDKSKGWNFPLIRLAYANGKAHTRIPGCDPFFAAYSKKLTSRLTCYSCPFCRPERTGDLTLADCWRVATTHPQYDDNRGTSLCLANSASGKTLLKEAETREQLFVGTYSLSRALQTNAPLLRKPSRSATRETILSQAPNFAQRLWHTLGYRFFIRAMLIWWGRRLGWFYFRRRQ